MIEILTLLMTICGVVATVVVMFLPALFELRKPKDAGPRLIIGNFATLPTPLTSSMIKNTPILVLSDIEGEGHAELTFSKLLGFLPNLESLTVE
jgi:hypothetical protein